MSDPTIRGAARLAALVALPVALLAGFVAYRVLRPDPAHDAPAAARPQATTAVEVAAPPLPERVATVCRALFARLPDRLGDLARRPVTAGPEQNAAWGDPAVTVQCGVAGPPVPANGQLYTIDRVCWYAEERGGAQLWSMQEREVPVLVTVPKKYTGQYLVDLAKPLSDSIARTSDTCTRVPLPSATDR